MDRPSRTSSLPKHDQSHPVTLVLMPDGRQVSLASLHGFQVSQSPAHSLKAKNPAAESDSVDVEVVASGARSKGCRLCRGLRAAGKLARKVAVELAPSSDQHMLTYEMAVRYGMIPEGTQVRGPQQSGDKMQDSVNNEEASCPVSIWSTDAARGSSRWLSSHR